MKALSLVFWGNGKEDRCSANAAAELLASRMNTGSLVLQRDPLSFGLSFLSGKIAFIVNTGIGLAKSGLSS